MKKLSASHFLSFFYLLLNPTFGFSQTGNWTDNLDLNAMVQSVPQANKFIDPGYYVWCGSVTKGDDGKFYMLYSRWPLKDGFYSWPVTSEIAVAVSASPAGPFKHLKVALSARGTQFWDGSATHNPAVVSYKGKYYLYYMGTSSTAEIKQPVQANGNWWHYRNSQRIGVAVADKPDGEWKRLDHPVLSVSPDSTAYDALMVSKNGTDWQPAKHAKVIGSTFFWEGGVASASKLERPCLYIEKGVPKYLYGATRADKEQTMSFNVAVLLIQLK